MSDLQLIEAALQRAAQRRRLERAFRGAWQGLLVGVLIWFITLAVYKLAPVPAWTLSAAVGVGVGAILTGLIIGGWRKTSLNEMARWVDGRQHLQERLSTALELSKVQTSEAWRELLVTDAASHVKEIDPRQLVRFRLPRTSRWVLLVMALCAGLGFVPEFRTKAYVQKQTDQKVIQEAGKQLLELTKQNLQSRKPTLEKTEKAMDAVSDLATNLTAKALTRSEALKDLAKLTDRIKDELKDLTKDPAMKKMEEAARAGNGETSPQAAQLQKEIEETQKQLGNSTATPNDLSKMEKKLQDAQQAAKAAADKNGNMSQADKEKISQSLAALSKMAQEQGMNVPNLDEAIKALAANQTGTFMKNMEAAMTDLEKTKDMAQNLQQMQSQMEKMGKDLAEQLQNGQPEAAQATLKKMIEQLKAAKLSPEQMKQMMSEVSKAVDPGSKYGKVGDLLKQAAKKMEQGDKPGSGECLAQASKELDDLMKQMGDAKSLLAELKALDKASMCVGSGQSWGSCNKPGVGNKPSGKPGSGVGTWENEDSGWGYDGQKTARWDNTGITRPDMKPKDLTDRGPGELNDALRPDKVKGQFQPGGQMPSITLKGVSIKGSSTVAYEEASVAAQADAQSALSHEKVPRAYQGAVRDYFDDLKKQ